MPTCKLRFPSRFLLVLLVFLSSSILRAQTEDVTLEFADDSIDALADLAAEINSSVENIGARRLHTVMERLLEDISFTATDRAGATITIDANYVQERVAPLAKNADLSRFIL